MLITLFPEKKPLDNNIMKEQIDVISSFFLQQLTLSICCFGRTSNRVRRRSANVY